MGILSLVQTIWGSGLQTYGQTSRLDVAQATGSTTLVLHDTGAQNKSTAELGTGMLALRSVTTQDLVASDQRSFQMDGRSRSLDAATLERLTDAGGDSATAYLDGVGFYGNAVSLHALEMAGRNYIYMSRPAGEGVSVYARASDGSLSFQHTVRDDDSAHLSGISAMDRGRRAEWNDITS